MKFLRMTAQRQLIISWMAAHYGDKPVSHFQLFRDLKGRAGFTTEHNVHNLLYNMLDNKEHHSPVNRKPMPFEHPDHRPAESGGRTQYLYWLDMAVVEKMRKAGLLKGTEVAAVRKYRRRAVPMPVAAPTPASPVAVQIIPTGCEVHHGRGEEGPILSFAEMLAVHAHVEALRKGGTI